MSDEVETTLLMVDVTRVGERWFVTPDAEAPATELVEPIHRDWHDSVLTHPSGRSMVVIAVPKAIGMDEDWAQ